MDARVANLLDELRARVAGHLARGEWPVVAVHVGTADFRTIVGWVVDRGEYLGPFGDTYPVIENPDLVTPEIMTA